MNNSQPLAPIVLFVFNRPVHTKKTLQALKENKQADESILYIYCDGVKDGASIDIIENNNQVRKVIREEQWCKEVIIIESKKNKGLANSVISGVQDVVNKYGKVIVLEDDLITSTMFLDFMNNALNLYENNKEVFQISGYNFPVPQLKSSNSSFFLGLASTWGWATWKRAWDAVDFECKDFNLIKEDKKLAYNFNQKGAYNYKKMFLQQMESSKISSWGIRFYWNVFKKNALVLYPDRSLVHNIGWDNSGKHKDNYDIFPALEMDLNYRIINFPEDNKINIKVEKIIRSYIKRRTSYRTKLLNRLINIIKK